MARRCCGAKKLGALCQSVPSSVGFSVLRADSESAATSPHGISPEPQTQEAGNGKSLHLLLVRREARAAPGGAPRSSSCTPGHQYWSVTCTATSAVDGVEAGPERHCPQHGRCPWVVPKSAGRRGRPDWIRSPTPLLVCITASRPCFLPLASHYNLSGEL